MALHLPIGPLKTSSGLVPILICEPSTYQLINRCHSHCAIGAGRCVISVILFITLLYVVICAVAAVLHTQRGGIFNQINMAEIVNAVLVSILRSTLLCCGLFIYLYIYFLFIIKMQFSLLKKIGGVQVIKLNVYRTSRLATQLHLLAVLFVSRRFRFNNNNKKIKWQLWKN